MNYQQQNRGFEKTETVNTQMHNGVYNRKRVKVMSPEEPAFLKENNREKLACFIKRPADTGGSGAAAEKFL